MEQILVYLLFSLGVYLIIKGGDWFVDAAVWIAKITGIPNVLIGATIVSLATTLPELVVSTIATIQGHPEMAIGNAVGSTICNIGLIMALAVLIRPQKLKPKEFTLKGVIMIVGALILWFASSNYVIDRQEGNILIFALLIYIVINIVEVRGDKSSVEIDLEFNDERMTRSVITKNIMKFLMGAVFIVVGARLLVTNGEIIARNFGIPERIIALTLIALGTSLPEFVTSITAAIKGHEGISIGNIIGANILNLFMVIGVSSKVSPLIIEPQTKVILGRALEVPQTLILDVPVSLLLMIILVFFGTLNRGLGRATGVAMLGIYLGYLTVIFKFFI